MRLRLTGKSRGEQFLDGSSEWILQDLDSDTPDENLFDKMPITDISFSVHCNDQAVLTLKMLVAEIELEHIEGEVPA